MSGRLGADALAAVAVGQQRLDACVFRVPGRADGTLAHHRATLRGRRWPQDRALHAARHVPRICLGVSSFILAGHCRARSCHSSGSTPGSAHLTVEYLRALLFGAPGIFMFLALRFTTEGIGYTRPIMFTSIFSLICNVFLNYALMFGQLRRAGAGRRGLRATPVRSRCGSCYRAGALHDRQPETQNAQSLHAYRPVSSALFLEIIVLGVPISITITAEAGLFAVVSILVGTRGVEITAAHQIAISYASAMFMIPLALSSATTVQVGHMLGAGPRRRRAHRRVCRNNDVRHIHGILRARIAGLSRRDHLRSTPTIRSLPASRSACCWWPRFSRWPTACRFRPRPYCAPTRIRRSRWR